MDFSRDVRVVVGEDGVGAERFDEVKVAGAACGDDFEVLGSRKLNCVEADGRCGAVRRLKE